MTTKHPITTAVFTNGDCDNFLALVDAVEATAPDTWARFCALRELHDYMTMNQHVIAKTFAQYLREPKD